MRYGSESTNRKFTYLLAATQLRIVGSRPLVVPIWPPRPSFFVYFRLSIHLFSLHTYDNAPNSTTPHNPHPPIHTTLCRIHIDQLNHPRPSSEATKQPE